MLIDLTQDGAAHLAEALKSHKMWAVRNGVGMPSDLLAMEVWARNRVRLGQDGSTFDPAWTGVEPESMAPRLLTLKETGRLLAVSESTVKRLVTEGSLATVHIGGAARIKVSAVDDYIEKLTTKEAAQC